MKIGILTHYNVNNQGAQLQMYAMKYWLEEHGHEVVILTYIKNFDFNEEEEQKNSGSISNVGYYVKNYLVDKGIGLTAFNTMKVLTHKQSFKEFETEAYDTENLDAIVIGSDEVFSIDVGCNQMMYGHGLKAPAIAYAPAFGRSTEELLKEYKVYDLIKAGLSDMYRLSARDSHTQEMIKNMTGREVPLVCDPVILYDGHAFKVPVRLIKKKFLLVYAYDRNMIKPKEIRAIKRYAKKNGLITVSLGTYHKWCDKNIVCNAKEWYSYFSEAECVVTDTFHGSVVAMKNHCKLAVFIRESINAYKMESLLEQAGLQEQRLKRLSLRELERAFSQQINYDLVDKNMEDLASSSEKYLLDSLDELQKKIIIEKEQIKNIDRSSKYACSGCGACMSICPARAITIKMNSCGFYRAIVDEEKCVHCQKCIDVCPRYIQEQDLSEREDSHNLYHVPIYAVQSCQNDVVQKCSSGGFAHEASLWALNNGYKVVGATYDYKTNLVKHCVVSQTKDLNRLDGSKYLQSNTKVFEKILKEAKLSKDCKYMVFGTPCQIAGLAQASKKENVRDQFILIDIFCHGVPSYLLWREELKEIRKKLHASRFQDVQFRYKKNDWHSYCLKIDGDGKTFYGSREKEIFYQVFFENILLGDACMNCEIRKEESFSDLRIGDYWGVKFQDRSDGVSAVYACTDVGNTLVHELLSGGQIMELDSADATDMLKAQNMSGYHQQKLHRESMKILEDSGDINKAIEYYRKRMSKKQKLKRMVLKASSMIPDDARAKLRKANSSRMLKKNL